MIGIKVPRYGNKIDEYIRNIFKYGALIIP